MNLAPHLSLLLSVLVPLVLARPQLIQESTSLRFDQGQILSLPLYDQQIVLGDAHQVPDSAGSDGVILRSIPTTVYKPSHNPTHEEHRFFSSHGHDREVKWFPRTIPGPDVHDRHTLAQLARMAGNAYSLPGRKNWYDLDEAWNQSFPFGWEDHSNGFRGHLFKSTDNSTVILSIKGTTVQGATSKKDKFNDNLLFSCCCARVDFSWVFRTVCDCYSGSSRCDNTCLSRSLVQDSLFYSTGVRMVNELIALYPTSTIWLVGHSLGGALASLLGSTFGLPAVAFESPGERLAARRLHLPLPPPLPPLPSDKSVDAASQSPPRSHPVAVTHVYHTADPIPLGACTGFQSPCERAGYALQSKCHLGKSIIYDTVTRLSWKQDIRRHPIKVLVHQVLGITDVIWEFGKEAGEVPKAREEMNCVECEDWEFGEYGKM